MSALLCNVVSAVSETLVPSQIAIKNCRKRMKNSYLACWNGMSLLCDNGNTAKETLDSRILRVPN